MFCNHPTAGSELRPCPIFAEGLISSCSSRFASAIARRSSMVNQSPSGGDPMPCTGPPAAKSRRREDQPSPTRSRRPPLEQLVNRPLVDPPVAALTEPEAAQHAAPAQHPHRPFGNREAPGDGRRRDHRRQRHDLQSADSSASAGSRRGGRTRNPYDGGVGWGCLCRVDRERAVQRECRAVSREERG